MKKIFLFLAIVLVGISSGQPAHALFSSGLTMGKVLAEQAYQSTTIFKASNLTLSATPYDYDSGSGKWNYRIDWQRMSNRTGSIYINGNVFVANASGTGSNFTGYSLSPDTNYRIVYYSVSNGKGVRIVNRNFKTLPAQESADDVEDDSGDALTPPPPIPTPVPTPPTPTPFPVPPTQPLRVGQLVNNNGTVELVGDYGLIGIPDLATFNSWCFQFSDLLPATNSEINTKQVSVLEARQSGQTLPNGVSVLRVKTCASDSSDAPRVGQLINNNGTVQLVGSNGLYGFPDLATFNSWGYSFAQVLPANRAEKMLGQIGIVPMKQSGCSSALDQIKGACGVVSPPITVCGSVILGDANCSNAVNIGDALVIQLHADGTTLLTGQALTNADVTGEGKVNGIDATLVSNYAGGLISQFPKTDGSVLSLGDVNNDNKITVADALKIQLHVDTSSKLTGRGLDNADVDGDGKITGTDATLVANYAGCLNSNFPRGASSATRTCSPTQPSITVLSPNGGEVLSPGSTYTVQWSNPGGIGPIDIFLVKGGVIQKDIGFAPGSGATAPTSFVWTVDSSLLNGTDYKIRVSNQNGDKFDESNAPFSVTAGSASQSLNISLNANSPTFQSINPGGIGYTFLVVDLTAGPLADVKLSKATFGVSGGAGPDVKNLRLQVGSQTFVGDISNPQLFSPDLVIPKGTTQTVKLTGDISSSATAGSQLLYALVNYNVTLATQNPGSGVTGTAWPSAYTHTVASAGSVSVSIDASTPPTRNIAPGTANVEMARVRFSATGEDVRLLEIAVSALGTNSDFSAIYLYDGSTQLGSLLLPSTIGGAAKFNVAPFVLTVVKNSSRTISIRADISLSAQAGNTLALGLQGASAYGVSSGATIPATGSANGNTMVIAQATSQVLGDANLDGSITIADSMKIQLHADGTTLLTGQALVNADVTGGEGVVNGIDALIVSQYAGGLITGFPKVDGSVLLIGDANLNGTVSIGDALKVGLYTSGDTGALKGRALDNADVDGDGRITSSDSTLISNFAGHVISVFPRLTK